jgi:hypothetical protein
MNAPTSATFAAEGSASSQSQLLAPVSDRLRDQYLCDLARVKEGEEFFGSMALAARERLG